MTTGNPRFRHIPTNTILLATISSDEFLAAIFPFELEKNTPILLFSGAALEKKPITAMYTDARVDGHPIKLILDTASTRIITADEATKTLIGEINEFSFEVNDIVTSIKVLVMEATQYQAFELQLMYQGQHIHVPAMCNHFKMPPREKLLIKLEKKKEKPIWEAYQTDNDESKPISSWKWEENKENKGKGKEKETTQTTTAYNIHTISQQSTYCRPKLICVNCGKKLSSMNAFCGDDEEYYTTTKFYCHSCLFEHFGQPKRQEKWNNQSCLTCGKTLLDEGM
ncbi:hypothetical protein G9A89_003439 [Geosiphon pyriformis]|nr:hypothetical protein G9A89_003439 [Geosiphon pyriformis]